MKIVATLKYLAGLAAIVFLFISWKVSIALFIIASILHVFPYGPRVLLSVLSGYSIIAGIILLFFNWRFGIGLIVLSFLIAKFRVWGDRKNAEYYGKNEDKHETIEQDTK